MTEPSADDLTRAQAQGMIAEIEAEMKRIGYWSPEAPPPEAYSFQKAFAMDTMSFSEWLQFVFIPRVHQVIDEKAPFPQNSMVGAQAIREYDGNDTADHLVDLLLSFDRLFTK
jgi:uncharacterized protein YqcC (DUF446 family)